MIVAENNANLIDENCTIRGDLHTDANDEVINELETSFIDGSIEEPSELEDSADEYTPSLNQHSSSSDSSEECGMF